MRIGRGWTIAAALSVAVFVSAVAAWAAAVTNAAPPVVHAVTIENMRFSPQEVTVHVSDVVEFHNLDLVPHTATSVSGHPFDSGILESTKVWRTTCVHEGRIEYRCNFHPMMTGSIIVAAKE
jgi:plastocyanin